MTRVALTPFGTMVANCLRDNAADYIAVDVFAHKTFGDAVQIYERLRSASQSISDYLDGKNTLIEYPR